MGVGDEAVNYEKVPLISHNFLLACLSLHLA